MASRVCSCSMLGSALAIQLGVCGAIDFSHPTRANPCEDPLGSGSVTCREGMSDSEVYSINKQIGNEKTGNLDQCS